MLCRYHKFVIKNMARVESMIKVLMKPHDPPDSFVEHYIMLLPEDKLSDFLRLVDLKVRGGGEQAGRVAPAAGSANRAIPLRAAGGAFPRPQGLKKVDVQALTESYQRHLPNTPAGSSVIAPTSSSEALLPSPALSASSATGSGGASASRAASVGHGCATPI